MKLLLIEDEKRLANAIEYLLKRNGYAADVRYDGASGFDAALSGIYDLLVIDIMLPIKSGLEILSGVRTQGLNTPVLLLTAKGTVHDKVTGLDLGADDYLVKPFSNEELLARLRALARRLDKTIVEEEIVLGAVRFLPLKNELSQDGNSVRLTQRENAILELLARNIGTVVTKEQLIIKVWGYDSYVQDNSLEVYISYLRKKLASLSCGIAISTIRGTGYMLSLKEDAL